VKKEEIEKIEQIPNNILNIPNIFRNIPLQNNSSFSSSDTFGTSSDMSSHTETDQQENERNFQPVLKVEHQVQTNSPRFEKKSRFRAKIGEIKITVSNDGSVLYCCPECNIGLPDKADVEQHIQAHLQVRNYRMHICMRYSFLVSRRSIWCNKSKFKIYYRNENISVENVVPC